MLVKDTRKKQKVRVTLWVNVTPQQAPLLRTQFHQISLDLNTSAA